MEDLADIVSNVISFCPPQTFLFFAGVSKTWKKAWFATRYPQETNVCEAAATQARAKWFLDDPLFRDACQRSVDPFGDFGNAMSLTAAAGNLGGLKAATSAYDSRWAYTRCGIQVTTAAADGGHLEVLKWASARGCPLGLQTSLAAVRAGRLKVLQWLVQQGCLVGAKTCTTAAGGGHLGVLQWARARGYQWSEDTCMNAALGGHARLLLWALAHECPSNEQTCAAAARGGHLNLLKLLRAIDCPWDECACSDAAHAGHLETLKWMIAQGCPWNRSYCLFLARKNRCSHVVEWILAPN